MDKQKKILLVSGITLLLLASLSIPAVLSNSNRSAESELLLQLEYTSNAVKHTIKENWIKPLPTDAERTRIVGELGTDIQVSSFEEDDAHPAVALDGSGNPFIAYDHDTGDFTTELYFQRSFDGGNTWPEDQIIVVGADEISPVRPTFDITSGGRGVATFYNDLGGTVLYLIDAVDIDDVETWTIGGFELSTEYLGESAIAVHDSNMAVLPRISDVTGSDGNTYEEKCVVMFANLDADSWPGVFYTYDAPMSNPDAAVGGDRLYAVCEVNDVDSTSLLVMYAPYDVADYTGWSGSQIARGGSNLTNPRLAISGTNRYCVAENDINGNKDILCYTQAGTLWKRYTVADSPDDELYPSITADGETATCTFIKNGNLYMSKSEDGGKTWSDPTQVNDDTGSAIADRRSADIEGPYMLWTDNRNGNNDIYFDVGTAPLISIAKVSGGFGVSATIENIGTGEATDVAWTMTVDAPLLLIGGEANGTIATLAVGGSTTVKSGFLLGFGRATITVTAGKAGATKTGFVLGPLVLGVK